MVKAKKLTDTYTLNNGVKIPVIGFGTWQTPEGEEAYNSVMWALEAGYRHIDTAAVYGNEVSVGKAIHDGMKKFNIKREELFITTKMWNGQRGSYEDSKRCLRDSLSRLGLDYVDLYLIHWPTPFEFKDRDWVKLNNDSWRAMEDAYNSHKTRAIGVSNFQIRHLEPLMQNATIQPMVNQLFINPGDPEEEMIKFDKEHKILTEAYSPLGTGLLLKDPILAKVADRIHKTPAQVLIRWSLEKGLLPLPKSVHQDRIIQNTQVFDFSLTKEDMKELEALEKTHAKHREPESLTFYKKIEFLPE